MTDPTAKHNWQLEELFAGNVKAVRGSLGWTQEALAEVMATTRVQVADIERARNSSTLRMVQRVAEALQVEPWVLLLPKISSRPVQEEAKTAATYDLEIMATENIRQLRWTLGVSQHDLGARMRVHRCYIADLERNRNCMTLATLQKVAIAFGVEPWVLLLPQMSRHVITKRRVRKGA